jgi:Rrf2 family cysteine metabolism transcriptional repressor
MRDDDFAEAGGVRPGQESPSKAGGRLAAFPTESLPFILDWNGRLCHHGAVRYTTKAEYGIVALMHLARAGEGAMRSAVEIAEAEGMSVEYVEKLLQRLRLFGLVESHRGAQGGFTLATEPARITLKHVIEALEGSTFQLFCADDIREKIVCNHLSACGISGVWNGLKGVVDGYLDGITLAQLMEGHEAAGGAPVAGSAMAMSSATRGM